MLNGVHDPELSHDAIYNIAIAGFNNLLYIFHKYFDSYKATSAPTVRIVGNKMQITINVKDKNNQPQQFKFMGEPKWKEEQRNNQLVTMIYFKF